MCLQAGRTTCDSVLQKHKRIASHVLQRRDHAQVGTLTDVHGELVSKLLA